MISDFNDKTLVDRFNSRDEKAMEALFLRYYAALCYFANKIVNDSETSKDIVQDIFARLFEKKNLRYENITALRAYLYSSVRNGSIDHIRRRENARIAADKSRKPDDPSEADIELFEFESDVLSRVMAAVEKLPSECKKVFELSYFERLSIKEISERLNIAETTVKTQRQRAKKRLKEMLQHLYGVTTLLFF